MANKLAEQDNIWMWTQKRGILAAYLLIHSQTWAESVCLEGA